MSAKANRNCTFAPLFGLMSAPFPDYAYIMMKRLRTPALFLTLVALTGCASTFGASKFSCPGGMGGMSCKSAPELYRATDGPMATNATDSSAGSKSRKGGGKRRSKTPVSDSDIDALIRDAFQSHGTTERTPQPTIMPDGTVPLREPAQVMRVWVAPYEDNRGNLHSGGYVYSEITPRRWSIGSQVTMHAPSLRPLQVDVPPPPTTNAQSRSRQPAQQGQTSGFRPPRPDDLESAGARDLTLPPTQ